MADSVSNDDKSPFDEMIAKISEKQWAATLQEFAAEAQQAEEYAKRAEPRNYYVERIRPDTDDFHRKFVMPQIRNSCEKASRTSSCCKP